MKASLPQVSSRETDAVAQGFMEVLIPKLDEK